MKYIKKDVTTVKRGIVAHGVNCRAVMGGGVALAIRKKWPKVYEEYLKESANSLKLIGTTQLVPLESELWVANCFTQKNFGNNPNVKYADPAAIDKCLMRVFEFAATNELPLYIPPIGCGLGGLKWEEDVEPLVKKHQDRFQVELYICDI